jgi:hypothetical protein
MSEEQTENLPISIEDQIKKELAEQSGQIGALPSNKIQLAEKKFTLPDGQSNAGPIEVVVLDFIWFMAHYPGVYNSASPQQPNCFAMGRDKPDSGLLKPHESVKKPLAKSCTEKACPMNKWKSSPTGNGKACKNQRRLIVVPPNFTEETEPMTMYVSPGGLKNFDAYVTRLNNEHGILPFQAITEVSFDKDKPYPLLQFKFLDKHTNANLAYALREQAQPVLWRELETKEDKK